MQLLPNIHFITMPNFCSSFDVRPLKGVIIVDNQIYVNGSAIWPDQTLKRKVKFWVDFISTSPEGQLGTYGWQITSEIKSRNLAIAIRSVNFYFAVVQYFGAHKQSVLIVIRNLIRDVTSLKVFAIIITFREAFIRLPN